MNNECTAECTMNEKFCILREAAGAECSIARKQKPYAFAPKTK